MADTTLPGLFLTGTHAARPAATAVGSGALYACSTHSLIYQSNGSAWSTWATLGSTGAAPDSADYLTGSAQAGLSGEIVVGTTPGGELGGTWASPTVDATHSGSAHHAQDHASRHASGGADSVKLDDLAAPDDNTDLNATTGHHGLMPKLDGSVTKYLDGSGAFSTPAGGGGGGGGGAGAYVGAKAYRTNAFAIGNNSVTGIQYDNEEFDSDGFHDNSTNPSRFTIPSGKGGKYLLLAGAFTEVEATWQFGFRKNGSTLVRGFASTPTAPSGSVPTYEVHAIADLAAGDYVEAVAYQTSGSNKNVGHSSGSNDTAAWAAVSLVLPGGGGGTGNQIIAVPDAMDIRMYSGDFSPSADYAMAMPVHIIAPMYVRGLVVNVAAHATGSMQWGLFDYHSNPAAATKLCGGSGAPSADDWQTIAADSAPVLVQPGAYMLVWKQASSNRPTLRYLTPGRTANPVSIKEISVYTWDDTPDFTTGWGTVGGYYIMFLRGDLDASTQW